MVYENGCIEKAMIKGSICPSVTAILVNYNSGGYAVECVRSLLAQQYERLDVIVVDNASPDGSAKLLRSEFPDRVRLIESPTNLGFGRANNFAASHATGDYLLLVNPDARLLSADFIQQLIYFMEQHPLVGIAGPEINEPRKQKFVLPKRTYPSQKRLKDQKPFEVLPGPYAWILGACMCIRRELYEKIGGFDPAYFLYGEDTDICLRIRKAGYEVGYCEKAKLTHVGGASEVSAIPLDKFLRKKRGFFLFCIKHYPAKDVRKIALKSLISTYFLSAKQILWGLLRLGNSRNIQNDIQKLEATRIVIREVLLQLKAE